MAWPDDAPTKDSTTMEANIPVFWDTASDGTVYCRDQHGKMHNTFTWSYLYNGTRDVRKAKAKEILDHYRQNASQTFSIIPWIFHDDAEPTITVRYNEGKAPSITNTQGRLRVSVTFFQVRDKTTRYT